MDEDLERLPTGPQVTLSLTLEMRGVGNVEATHQPIKVTMLYAGEMAKQILTDKAYEAIYLEKFLDEIKKRLLYGNNP